MPLTRVIADFTPLLPGGQNGGAGLVASSVVREMAVLAPQVDFTLLTNPASHDELAPMERDNIRRHLAVTGPSREPAAVRPLRLTAKRAVRGGLRVLPTSIVVEIKARYWQARFGRTCRRLTESLGADVLLAPFTLPTYASPEVPLVTVVYDLQHLTFPEFFAAEQRAFRSYHVREAFRRSAAVICISEYVSRTLSAHLPSSTGNPQQDSDNSAHRAGHV